MRALLLPGLDGGAALSASFREALLPKVAAQVFPYPPDEAIGYRRLEERVRAALDSTGAVAIIAESFSGPLAIPIAASPPPHLRCLVLVATFDRSPAPRFLSAFVGLLMFRRPPPAFVIRRLMLGAGASDEEVARVQRAIRSVDAPVLAKRLKDVLSTNVSKEMAAIGVPALSLRPTNDRLVRRRLSIPSGGSWEEETVRGPHLVLQRRPEACAERIGRFLMQHA